MADHQEILDFWFSEDVRRKWFRSTPELDRDIRLRFEETWRAGAAGELAHWEATASGALALVILLDQFPLNMYRGEARSFSSEEAARAVADRALARALDAELTPEGRAFLYMPFMHSESLSDQDRSVALYEAAGLEDNLRFARHHREIVRRFGRFPHRNGPLGRPSTEEEIRYLQSKEGFHG